MNNEQQFKYIKFKESQARTAQNVANAVSSLDNAMLEALKVQAYMHSNPDSIIDESNLTKGAAVIDAIAVQYSEVVKKYTDMLSVKDKTMTADELVSKYSLDVQEYSDLLG